MRVDLMSAATYITKAAVTHIFSFLNVPQNRQLPYSLCTGTPSRVWRSRSLAPESQRQLTKAASAVSMNAAALLGIKVELGKLRHKGALITEQFQLLRARTKDGTVTEELLGLLNQAWALRCDGTLDEGEYAEDIGTVIGEMQPPRRMSSTAAAPTLALQMQSVPPPAPSPAAVGSRADRRKNGALAKAAKGSLNIVNAFIRGQGGKPVSTYSTTSEC